MQTTVGIFANCAAAERAVRDLYAVGLPVDRVTRLAPGDVARATRDIPSTESEPPGIGRTLGAGVGGAAGAGGGLQAAALTSVFIPGVGPVIAFGVLGAVVLGLAGAAHAEGARRVLAAAGAESLDAAREQWWLGLRDAEAASYAGEGRDFVRDEADYRRGYEAALTLGRGTRAYADLIDELRARYPGVYESDAFRRGWERGQATERRRRRAA